MSCVILERQDSAVEGCTDLVLIWLIFGIIHLHCLLLCREIAKFRLSVGGTSGLRSKHNLLCDELCLYLPEWSQEGSSASRKVYSPSLHWVQMYPEAQFSEPGARKVILRRTFVCCILHINENCCAVQGPSLHSQWQNSLLRISPACRFAWILVYSSIPLVSASLSAAQAILHP